MRVLIVARCKQGRFAPFITEQVEALKSIGVECSFFPLPDKGLSGYLRQFSAYRKRIKQDCPDIIHAHYGLSGLFANSQRKVPVITTFHGSDINNPRIRPLSKIAYKLSAYSVFVSQKCMDIAHPKGDKYALIPCGINLDDYPIIDKAEARRIMGLDQEMKYVLFAGAFSNHIKNAPLATKAVKLLKDVKLLELNGYSRFQVAVLMQAVDTMIMTSFSEGSPQVVKEAFACGCPIVSVDVGDVRERISSVDGCYISDRDPESIASWLRKALSFSGKTQGRRYIEENGLDNGSIALRIKAIYSHILGWEQN